MRLKPTFEPAMRAVAVIDSRSRTRRGARSLTSSGLATVLALMGLALIGLGCSDPAGSTSTDGDATTDDTSDVQAIDGAVKSDTPPPLPDLPTVDECATHEECDDGLFCNGAETCNPTAVGAGPNGCLPGEAPVMTDDDPRDCEVPATCDEETDSFPTKTLEAGDACDDAIACTSDDICTADGVCTGVKRDDLCSDGLYCNGVESCNSDIGCIPGVAPVGSDPSPGDCLVAGPCEEATNSFLLIPAPLDTPCDDGVACTKSDGCTSGGTCAGTPTDAACSDGVFCNGVELCTKTGCVAGSDAPPDDPTPNDCETFGTCDEETDSWTLVPRAEDSPCDDGVACTTADTCQDVEGTLTCTGDADATLCDDGAFCNGAEQCTSKGCIAGTPPDAPTDDSPDDCTSWGPCDDALGAFTVVKKPAQTDCDDGASCTSGDTCDEDGSCIGTPNHAACDDGEFCNGVEVCSAAGCGAGTPPLPPEDTDPNDCIGPGTCNEQTDSYPMVPQAGTACTDGVACTLDDACDAQGICTGTPDHGACDDGAYCNGAEQCTSAGCADGAPPVAPEDPNVADCSGPLMCDETTDSFPFGALGDGAGCNDGVDCTTNDVCTAGSCGGTPTSALCDDGIFCNGTETCDGVACVPGDVPTAPPDADPTDCLVAGACSEAAKSFPLAPAAELAPCDDGVECTVLDRCDAGGSCQGSVDDTLCMDGLVCNGDETCSLAGCLPGTPLEPETGEVPECMRRSDECSELDLGFPLVPDVGASCDDGVSCTNDDMCDATGICMGMPDTMLCDDGDLCNGAETCDLGGCTPGTPVEPPNDPNPNDCIVLDTCDPSAGEYGFTQANDGIPCLDFEGAPGQCLGGGCSSGP